MKKKILLAILFSGTLFFTAQVRAQTSVPIYKYYNGPAHKHFDTNSSSELGLTPSGDWTYEGVLGNLYGESLGSPVYRFNNPTTGAHYYTTYRSNYPGGFVYESILGYEFAAPESSIGSPIPVYEYYNSSVKDFYYTTNSTTPAGYVLDGVAYYVY